MICALTFNVGAQSFSLIKVDLSSQKLAILPMTKRGSVRRFARRNKAFCAINTTPFDKRGKAVGLVIAEGAVISEPLDKYCAIAFYKTTKGYRAKIFDTQSKVLLESFGKVGKSDKDKVPPPSSAKESDNAANSANNKRGISGTSKKVGGKKGSEHGAIIKSDNKGGKSVLTNKNKANDESATSNFVSASDKNKKTNLPKGALIKSENSNGESGESGNNITSALNAISADESGKSKDFESEGESLVIAMGGFWVTYQEGVARPFKAIKNTRSAVALDETGTVLYLFAGKHLTFDECTQILRKEGAATIMQFDGGHSTSFVVNGKERVRQIFRRRVPFALAFVAQEGE